MTTAGRFRHRVMIENCLRIRDPITGGYDEEWIQVAKVWAEIEPLSARDFVASRSEQSVINARICIRWRPDITPSMRIVHESRNGRRIFNIQGVLPDRESGQDYLTMPVTEVYGHGETSGFVQDDGAR